MDPDITVGSHHCQLEEIFQFPCLVSIIRVSKAIQSQKLDLPSS